MVLPPNDGGLVESTSEALADAASGGCDLLPRGK